MSENPQHEWQLSTSSTAELQNAATVARGEAEARRRAIRTGRTEVDIDFYNGGYETLHGNYYDYDEMQRAYIQDAYPDLMSWIQRYIK